MKTAESTVKNLIQLSPVPINFITLFFGFCGEYCYRGPYTGHPHINIDNSLQEHESLAVLAHEIGHAICGAKNCYCLKNPDRAIREFHAHKWSLKWMLKNKQAIALRWELQCIKGTLKRNDYYHDAAKQIKKTRLWRKCVKYVGL
jgi:hypothetical protein